MSLTNRLTLFFLVALAVVLGAFSTTMYVLARTHLMRQVDERAASNLDTLVAAAEVEPDGLEWDRGEHSLWPAAGEQPIAWAIFDSQGRDVDGKPEHIGLLQGHSTPAAGDRDDRVAATWQGQQWRVYRHTSAHPRPDIKDRRPPPAVPRIPGNERYAKLMFIVAAPLDPVYGMLRSLAWGLGGVSVALWVGAGVCGRWVCRRALAPVSRMTESARQITAADMGERLPTPSARDELYDLAGAFNALLTRLQDSFERQRRFTGEASHQLRTPLTAMLGQMEVALRRDRDPDEYRRALTTAVAQAGRLRQIVESLLFLARADADAELPGLEVIDLAAWVGEYHAGHPHERGADIRLSVPPAAVPVKAQPAMLAQVVGNLIDNACKYSDPGTPVIVSVAVEGGAAILAVEDAGHGIEASEIGRIFEPFFRSTEALRRGVGGLGLGLALAARIVRSFGGRIEMRSEPGRGSRFVVRLPLAPEVITPPMADRP